MLKDGKGRSGRYFVNKSILKFYTNMNNGKTTTRKNSNDNNNNSEKGNQATTADN